MAGNFREDMKSYNGPMNASESERASSSSDFLA